MSALRTSILAVGRLLALLLISAVGAKEGPRPGRTRPPGLSILVLGFVLLRIFRPGTRPGEAPRLTPPA